jgi:hypothetical protein
MRFTRAERLLRRRRRRFAVAAGALSALTGFAAAWPAAAQQLLRERRRRRRFAVAAGALSALAGFATAWPAAAQQALRERRRRRFAVAAGALSALAGITAGWSASAHHGYRELLDFAVLRGGTPIGFHRLDFRDVGDETHVEVDVELQVKLGFVTLFRYEHRNREVWRNGLLQRIDSQTNDDGTKYQVKGELRPEGLIVKTLAGEHVFGEKPMSATYWHPDTIKQSALLDTQRGGLLKVDVAVGEVEDVELGNGTRVKARRYELKGDLNITLWYTAEGQWVALKFAARGSDIQYALHPGGRPKGRS